MSYIIFGDLFRWSIFLGSVSAKDKDEAIEKIKAEIKIVPVNMIISYNPPNG